MGSVAGYQRTTAGDEYPRHYRCPRPADGSLAVDEGAEQLLLDPNQLADGGFLSSAPSASAPTRSLLACSLDTSGDEIYRLFVKDLASGAVQALPFDDCDGSPDLGQRQPRCSSVNWTTPTAHWLYRHRLGEAGAELVFEEGDGRFFLHCYRSSSERQLITPAQQQDHQRGLGARRRPAAGNVPLPGAAREGHEYYPTTVASTAGACG